MDPIAIRVENLGKRYRIGARERQVHTLRERLQNLMSAPWSYLRSTLKPPTAEETLWALRDVSFEIKRGEVVGLLGPNGAGKSTLLKILSRITEPTTGRAELHGRVSSLLEVGTGFHPELSGRENVYLNGAILGMTAQEIDANFDEIVAFSGIERFMDTPVKRYSSGMYVRLAFAVAAHLEPEILLVDEVLSVGDAAFQKKCLGKIGSVVQAGRTVLFVSHNMAAIRELCPSSIWIHHGRIQARGSSADVIQQYLKCTYTSSGTCQSDFPEDLEKDFQLRSARLLDENGEVAQHHDCDQPILLELHCQVNRIIPGLYGYLEISRADGTTVMVSDSFDAPPNPLDDLPQGRCVIEIEIPPRTLGAGGYRLYMNFTSSSSLKDYNVDSPGVIATFDLDDQRSRRGNKRPGYFSTMLPWSVQRVSADQPVATMAESPKGRLS